MSSKRIFAFHLLNDYSGSPKVLSQLISIWVEQGYDVHLYTSNYSKGILSDIPNIQYHYGWYRFSTNPLLRLVYYTLSQFILFFKMLFVVKKSDIVYVNTVLPFGAAILGKLKGCRVIYHIHESTVNPRILKWFLFKIVEKTATEIINVSNYVAKSHQISHIKNHLVYNAIDEEFLRRANSYHKTYHYENVLMISSLKSYKGVYEFTKLAKSNPNYMFKIVLNATRPEIDTFFSNMSIPINLCIYEAQRDIHPYYKWADIVLNLSKPDGWIETFGLTIIEGMAYGLPSIVPPVGGIVEVIENGKTGLSQDSRDIESVNQSLQYILSNKEVYDAMSQKSKERLALFSENQFREKTIKIIENI